MNLNTEIESDILSASNSSRSDGLRTFILGWSKKEEKLAIWEEDSLPLTSQSISIETDMDCRRDNISSGGET